MLLNSTISVKRLLLTSYLLAVAITYFYAKSVTIVYGVLELLIAAICYVECLRQYPRIDRKLFLLCLCAVLIAWFSGVIHGDPKSTLLITVPLVMPLYISILDITYKDWKDFVPVTIVAVVISFLTIERGLFGEMNSNTLGFLAFMGVSLGILLVQSAKYKLIAIAVVTLGFLLSMNSGSRNVAIVGLICVALLFVPKSVFRKRAVYIAICVIVVGYSIFAEDIMAWAFSKPKIYDALTQFTDQYSDKVWEMAARVDFLKRVQRMITSRDLFIKLFGTGTLTTHGHNMFYQCVLNFGYIGTVLIYAMFYRIFKVAFRLIKNRQDDLALGCVIILWGSFLLQGADVFMIGPETYAVVPQVVMGILLNRYAAYRREMVQPSRVETQGNIT